MNHDQCTDELMQLMKQVYVCACLDEVIQQLKFTTFPLYSTEERPFRFFLTTEEKEQKQSKCKSNESFSSSSMATNLKKESTPPNRCQRKPQQKQSLHRQRRLQPFTCANRK
jgi:sortase (surface protein transpeptidase)